MHAAELLKMSQRRTNMIFASDLDRTLLFSKKNFNDCVKTKEISLIDIKPDGETISFMLTSVLKQLQTISKQITFIPVTAREVHQLANVKFQENGVLFKYAITGNGSTILENGLVHKEWEKRIHSIKENIDINKLSTIIEKEFPGVKIRERSFGFEIFEKNISNKLNDIAKNFPGIRTEEDHRRSYLMYEGVDKLSALKFLQNTLNDDFVIASGDSLMDLPMILEANVGIVCSSGDLVNYRNIDSYVHVIRTKSENSSASEELMEIVLRHL